MLTRLILTRSFAPRLLAALGTSTFLMGSIAPAAEPWPPSALAAPVETDSLLSLQAKAAIATNPELAGLNLVVSVLDRVAVIGGPVPDARLIPKIERTVRGVNGVSVVKVSCWVVPPTDPLPELVSRRLNPEPLAPTKEAWAPVPVDTPKPGSSLFPPLAIRPPVTHDPRPVSTLTATAKPVPVLPDERTAAKLTMPSQDDFPGGIGFLLDPIATNAAPIPVAPSYPTIPPTAVPTQPVSSHKPADPIGEIRQKDSRYVGLSVRMTGGTATISGRATLEDAWQFADELRRVPGVHRVVVGYVR